jgi:hypothetical protein
MDGSMFFGNVPAETLVDAAEKILAKIGDADIAASYEREISRMPGEAFAALIESIFAAFRERGESSEDAAEEAGTTLEQIEQRHDGAADALLQYARSSPYLLQEATMLFIEQRPELISALPAAVRDPLAAYVAVP